MVAAHPGFLLNRPTVGRNVAIKQSAPFGIVESLTKLEPITAQRLDHVDPRPLLRLTCANPAGHHLNLRY